MMKTSAKRLRVIAAGAAGGAGRAGGASGVVPSDDCDGRAVAVDIAVVGAGPAGLAAAAAAADAGATVALVDAETSVGGQFWRHPAPGASPTRVRDSEVAGLHHGLRAYRSLRRSIETHRAAGRLRYLARHEVWALEQPAVEASAGSRFSVFAVGSGAGSDAERYETRVDARALVLAPGAYDLQIPFPGWDLPGVMTAGGVQSLLKGHAVLAGSRVVVAGTGPFLLSVAAGLVQSGASVPAVVESNRPTGWVRHLGVMPSAGRKIVEGIGYAAALARRRVGYRTGWTIVRAEGDGELEAVVIAPVDRRGVTDPSRAQRIATDVLAVGWGFVPQWELPLMVGCATTPGADGLPIASVDAWQRSSVSGVYLAGEVCGVGGAELAAIEGELAGAAAARDLHIADAAEILADHLLARRDIALIRRRIALRRFAAALATVYPPPTRWAAQLPDDAMVCRCEEVRAGAIRAAAIRDGAGDARSAKLLTRAGMGYCQGRICGYATECIAAAAAGSKPHHSPTERPVAAPIPLGLLAAGPPTVHRGMGGLPIDQ